MAAARPEAFYQLLLADGGGRALSACQSPCGEARRDTALSRLCLPRQVAAAVTGGGKDASPARGNGTAAAPAAPATAVPAGAGVAAPAVVPERRVGPPPGVDVPAYETARAAFLRQAGPDYGYGGLIDALYPKEVGIWGGGRQGGE